MRSGLWTFLRSWEELRLTLLPGADQRRDDQQLGRQTPVLPSPGHGGRCRHQAGVGGLSGQVWDPWRQWLSGQQDDEEGEIWRQLDSFHPYYHYHYLLVYYTINLLYYIVVVYCSE